MVGLPMLLVMKQPDLGTTLTYRPILIAGLFLGGINLRQGLILPTVGVALLSVESGPAASFLKPTKRPDSPASSTPKTTPAAPAIRCSSPRSPSVRAASGARDGERHTDAGLLPAHSLYGLHLRRIQRRARLRRRIFYPAAILSNIDAFDSKRSNSRRPARFPHYHGNRGCVDLSDCCQRRHGRRDMPVTGIPLPLMSYGGSSVLFTFLALGVVMNVRMRRFVN